MKYFTIRIDEEVMKELEKRIISFNDNPNQVLRREYKLPSTSSRDATYGLRNGSQPQEESISSIENNTGIDQRVLKLLKLLGKVAPPKRSKRGSFRLYSNSGKVFGHVDPQKKRLKVSAKKSVAVGAGARWQRELKNGWYNIEDEVYWYIPDDNEQAYSDIGGIISRLATI